MAIIVIYQMAPKGRSFILAAADTVIDADGTIIKSKNWETGYKIDIDNASAVNALLEAFERGEGQPDTMVT